ncbi:MAG: acyl-CoA dehydrogenase family protein, partial [Dehalococcoidia bacterium]|nr:acyl-CoA dehydrogenase family protein [Dehalococcoidia bacterium]
MDWDDNNAQNQFRSEVKTLIKKLPDRYQEMSKGRWTRSYTQWARDRISDDEQSKQDAENWFDAFAEKSWVAPHWPKEYGGGGLSTMEQFILKQELATANAPGVGSNVGLGMLGPALIVHGTDEQKSEFLPPILKGDVVWCQGFSEPGAGSDLASLQTRAVKDGDEYVINGQKTWTTHGHYADWILLLTRTDATAPKHRGISFLLADIKSEGVTVNPIYDMSWGHEVNEDFFEDVRIPATQIVGEENRGWYVGMTLLDNERSNIEGAIRQQKIINRMLNYIHKEDGKLKSRINEYDGIRQEVASAFVDANVMFNFSLRIISMQNEGQVPNYEASVSKLFGS